VFHTVEVRWFRRGDLPRTVLSWFNHCPGKASRLEERTDAYLLTHVDNLGIKIREGRLEIKFRTHWVGKREFLPKLTGMVEHWAKVGFGEEMVSLRAKSMEQPGTSWLDVRKARLVRHYTQADSGDIVPIATDAVSNSPSQLEADGGCSLEITEIEVPQGKWWSLGLEAFGSEERREELLTVVTKHLGSLYDSPLLEFQTSYGYPYWLANL